ncbi:hypothetical protein AURDEDRAFT_163488 [Auricularia subglabra TFB-10046 SS5]|nr:hypothetical protein AURDEDRAFT_163488 [Auricularia subglabra TFB-10046 SS5]
MAHVSQGAKRSPRRGTGSGSSSDLVPLCFSPLVKPGRCGCIRTPEVVPEGAGAARQVPSLCLLGLVDPASGGPACSNKSLFNIITDEVQWVRKARWVEDGNVWTASGVEAGVDMTIAFITRLARPTVAGNVTSGAEYSACEQDNDPFAEIWSDEAQKQIAESSGLRAWLFGPLSRSQSQVRPSFRVAAARISCTTRTLYAGGSPHCSSNIAILLP